MSVLLAVVLYAAIAVAMIYVLGSLTTFLVERNPYQQMFVAGRAPDPLPEGFHPGKAHVLLDKQTPWLGKSFDAEARIGFNIFTPIGARILKIASPLYQKFSVNNESSHFWLRRAPTSHSLVSACRSIRGRENRTRLQSGHSVATASASWRPSRH